MRACCCAFTARSSVSIALLHVATCAGRSRSTPDHPQPSAAPGHTVGRCGQAPSWAARATRVVSWPQCVHGTGNAAIARSAMRERLDSGSFMRHSGQRRLAGSGGCEGLAGPDGACGTRLNQH